MLDPVSLFRFVNIFTFTKVYESLIEKNTNIFAYKNLPQDSMQFRGQRQFSIYAVRIEVL